MTTQELKEFVLKERIKAYIYFGIEAEMELVNAHYDLTNATEDEDRVWENRRIKRNQLQIEKANKRIDDLQVHHGVTSENS